MTEIEKKIKDILTTNGVSVASSVRNELVKTIAQLFDTEGEKIFNAGKEKEVVSYTILHNRVPVQRKKIADKYKDYSDYKTKP